MFNDKYGLTQAVLEGRKTMTRRIMPSGLVEMYLDGREYDAILEAPYKHGEEVAVAQAYKDLPNVFAECGIAWPTARGWGNKMFVKADLMPHRIRITDIKVERLQGISDEDCLKEGVEEDAPYYWVPINYELPNWKKLEEKVSDMYANNDGKIYPHFWDSPRKAFSALIDAVCGKGTWERNPWVFVYEFELVNGD